MEEQGLKQISLQGQIALQGQPANKGGRSRVRKTLDIYVVGSFSMRANKYCLTPESAAKAIMLCIDKSDRGIMSEEGLIKMLKAMKIGGEEKRLVNSIYVYKHRAA